MNEVPDHPDKPRRGRPRTGNAMTDAERARRYRERKKTSAVSSVSSRKNAEITIESLRNQLDKAQKEIQFLKSQLALFVTKNQETGKTWALQERKGNTRWLTVEKGLTRLIAETKLDKLIGSIGSSRYSYRIIEE